MAIPIGRVSDCCPDYRFEIGKAIVIGPMRDALQAPRSGRREIAPAL